MMKETANTHYKKFGDAPPPVNTDIEIDLKKRIQDLQKENVLKRLQVKYHKYFKHWRDFDLLTTILAMIGLGLAIVDVRNPYMQSYSIVRDQFQL